MPYEVHMMSCANGVLRMKRTKVLHSLLQLHVETPKTIVVGHTPTEWNEKNWTSMRYTLEPTESSFRTIYGLSRVVEDICD